MEETSNNKRQNFSLLRLFLRIIFAEGVFYNILKFVVVVILTLIMGYAYIYLQYQNRWFYLSLGTLALLLLGACSNYFERKFGFIEDDNIRF